MKIKSQEASAFLGQNWVWRSPPHWLVRLARLAMGFRQFAIDRSGISCRSHHKTTTRDLRICLPYDCLSMTAAKIPAAPTIRQWVRPLPHWLSLLFYGPSSEANHSSRHESLPVGSWLFKTGLQSGSSEEAAPSMDHCFADSLSSLSGAWDRRTLLPEISDRRLPAVPKVRNVKEYFKNFLYLFWL